MQLTQQLFSQGNLVFQTGSLQVNLPLVDKAENQDNLVLHRDNLERNCAG